MQMKLSFNGVFFTLAGLLLVIFHSTISRLAVKWNYRMIGIRFNEQGYKIGSILVGLIFIISGLLTLFREIK
jgi:hypothetical protein